MSRVIVGVDPHKKQVTIEAVDQDGKVLAVGEFGTDNQGYRLMLAYVRRQWRRTTGGRWREPTGWAGHWRSVCSPRVRTWWTCRRSWRHGCGCSTPAMPARPTQSTRMRWRW
jgi:hypothetical protein